MDKSGRIKFFVEDIQDQLALGKTVDEAARRLRAIASDEEIECAVAEVRSQIAKKLESDRVKTI